MIAAASHHLRLLHSVWLLIVVLAISLTLAGIPAQMLGLQAVEAIAVFAWPILGIEISLALVFFTTALFVAWKRPNEPIALFLALTLVLLGAIETSMTDALINPEYSVVWAIWRWPVLILRALEMICTLTLLYIFPDGRFTPRWTRPLAIIWALLTVAWLIFPDLPFNTIYGPTWRATPVASLLVGVGWFSTGILALVLRYLRVEDAIQRQQTWWIAVGLIAAVLGGIAYYGLQALTFGLGIAVLGDAYWVGRYAFQAFGMAFLPLCLAVAILRYRLFDLEIILNRALVYGALTTFVIGVYVGIVVYIGALLQSEGNLLLSLLATSIVAVLFQPLRERLQRGVDRLIYGARHEPYQALAQLGRHLEGTIDPNAILPTIVETVATALKLPYVAVVLVQGEERLLAASSGDPAQQQTTVQLPLNVQGELLGYLILAPRPGELALSSRDQQLLKDLARQAGIAVRAVRLTAELQRSRERLVSAQEEERRRIQRDLHDGLGPTLASIAQRIEMAALTIPNDPQASTALLHETGEQARGAVAELRRLVYNLRPPALDQYGLAGAVRNEVERLRGALSVYLDLPERFPPLPAAIEAAAYRIICEALTNVIRHAEAQHCRISLRVVSAVAIPSMQPEWLEIDICDDGRGFAAETRLGVGLQAIRERTAELGGTWAISTTGQRGTRLFARLPLLPSLR